MSDRNRKIYYYPAMLYLLLLLFIWLASWFVGVAGLFSGGGNSVSTLISSQGVRWALRTSQTSIEGAPWGVATVLVVCVGLLRASGIIEALLLLLKGRALDAGRRTAGCVALVTLFCILLLLYLCSVAPWHILAGVTPGFWGSPLALGWILLLLIVVVAVSLMYGAVYGTFRSISDVMQGACGAVALFAPAFVAMLPASGVLPCLAYLGVVFADGVAELITVILYSIPFVYVLLFSLRNGSLRLVE